MISGNLNIVRFGAPSSSTDVRWARIPRDRIHENMFCVYLRLHRSSVDFFDG